MRTVPPLSALVLAVTCTHASVAAGAPQLAPVEKIFIVASKQLKEALAACQKSSQPDACHPGLVCTDTKAATEYKAAFYASEIVLQARTTGMQMVFEDRGRWGADGEYDGININVDPRMLQNADLARTRTPEEIQGIYVATVNGFLTCIDRQNARHSL